MPISPWTRLRFAALVLAALFVLGDDRAQAETRAIVIGITDYSYQAPLPGAAPDAKDIQAALATARIGRRRDAVEPGRDPNPGGGCG